MLPKLSAKQAEMLERRPSIEEIKQAIWNCESTKSPGYNEFNFNFIKNMWDVFGGKIVNFVLNFFDNGMFQEEINMTWVVLFQKLLMLLIWAILGPLVW